jgi:hypothetical protein
MYFSPDNRAAEGVLIGFEKYLFILAKISLSCQGRSEWHENQING